MIKRKTESPSKHARSPKITAKTQRAKQAVVRSPKEGRLRSVAAGSRQSPFKGHNGESQQEAPLVENPVTASQDNKQPMKDIVSSKGFDYSSATANVRA